jgi:hypothetical protein
MHVPPPRPQLPGDVPVMHESPSQQPLHVEGLQLTGQVPQSDGQDEQVSTAPSQNPSPQEEHEPQSREQLAQVSPPSQRPSPHASHEPQSVRQVAQVSPAATTHDPLPQVSGGGTAQFASTSMPRVSRKESPRIEAPFCEGFGGSP